MTPILGLIIAIIAARLAPNGRALLTAVLALIVAATAVQTWDLGAGLGHNPPSTVREASYWVVQAIVVTITLAIAFGFFALRRRRADRRGESLHRAGFTGRRGVISTSLIGTLMTVVGIAVCLALGSSGDHHATGSGGIPWTGVAGISSGLLLVFALLSALVRESRAERSRTAPAVTS